MALYQEIILLKSWFKGKWCIENVVSYYEPLIQPTQFGSHYFWTNFYFPSSGMENLEGGRGVGGRNEPTLQELANMKGFDLKDLDGIKDKRLALRDVTEPELGKHILDWAMKEELALF